MVRSSISQTDTAASTIVGPTNQKSRIRNTFWMAIILFGAIIGFAVYTLYLALQAGAWQLFAVSSAEWICGGLIAYAAYLCRRNRVDLGIKLTLGAVLLLGLIITVLTANVGLVVGFAVIIVTWVMSSQIQDQKWGNGLLIAGFAVGIIVGALDIFPLPSQLPVLGVQNMAPWAAGLIVLSFIGIIIWQFKSYNLRTKLMTVFLLVSIVSVGAIAFFNYRTTRAELTNNVGASLRSLADSGAVAVGDLLDRQLDNLQVLSLNEVLQAKIKGRNSTYTGSPEAIQAKLEELDQFWQTAEDTEPLVQIHFNMVTNAGASELNEFRKLFPNHVELFITDRYGGLVAATNRTSDYYQADEDWWQAAFNGGQGAVYIDQPAYDESSATLSLRMAVPIYSREPREVIGVLRTSYRISTVLELLDSIRFGQTGRGEIYLPGGLELEADYEEAAEADDLEPQELALLLAGQMDFVESSVGGTPLLVSAAPVSSIGSNPAIDDLDWSVIVRQARQEALAPLQGQLRNTLFISLVIIGLVSAAAVILAQILAGPIMRLTRVAQQVTGGDLDVQGRVESNDEIGQLTQAFNMMTGRLRKTIDSLETQVTDRTHQLETALEVSQRLVGILDLSDLLRQVVILTKEIFGYYHVHIYLREEQTLLMAEGYGEAGAEMKRQGHHIPMDAPQSLVARAAREQKVIIVENVRLDPSWLPNPLLPDTHSEMAVPVLLGDEVVGVLDVQSEKVGGLTEEDETTLQLLVNQIAVAVRNARAFAQTQEALYEAQRLQRLYTAEAWERFHASQTTTDYEYREPTLPPLQEITTPEAVAALRQQQTITLLANKGRKKNGSSQEESPDETQSPARVPNALATPLKLGEEIIGVMGLHVDDPERRWTEEEIALIEAVSEQMSLALENARLFDHTQRDAWRNQVVSETTAKVWASGDIEEVMKAAVAELGHRFKASEVVIRLGLDSELDKEEKS